MRERHLPGAESPVRLQADTLYSARQIAARESNFVAGSNEWKVLVLRTC